MSASHAQEGCVGRSAHLPDYGGGGIVNLMASIAGACGGGSSGYRPLSCVDSGFLARARHIVLLVIDGLGYDYLNSAGAGSCLHDHLKARLTSVFPSTTASAVTCLLSGMPAQQHGLTGWHVYFRELGAIASVLPLTPRHGGPAFTASGVKAASLLSGAPLFDRLDRPSHVVTHAEIVDSDFSRYYGGGAKRSGYDAIEQCFERIAENIRNQAGPSFTHAYYSVLDATAHQYGSRSEELNQDFGRLDRAFAGFLRTMAGSDTAVLVTADHGFIDSPPEHLIEMERHPELARMLTLPLCGERRVAYCYVHPRERDNFESYVATQFAGCARAVPSEDLLAQGWFGLGSPHPRLLARIGDYTLLMEDDWTIKDWVHGEHRHRLVGVHGGTSSAEMFVPLVVVQT